MLSLCPQEGKPAPGNNSIQHERKAVRREYKLAKRSTWLISVLYVGLSLIYLFSMNLAPLLELPTFKSYSLLREVKRVGSWILSGISNLSIISSE